MEFYAVLVPWQKNLLAAHTKKPLQPFFNQKYMQLSFIDF